MKSAVCIPLLLTFLLTPSLATAQFAGMRVRVPADANTLVLINAQKMFGSRIADREGLESQTAGCLRIRNFRFANWSNGGVARRPS